MTETSQGSQPIQTDQGGIQEDSIATEAFGPNTVAHSWKRGRCSMDMEADCENDLPFLHQEFYAIAKAQEIQCLAVFDYWVNEKKSEIDAQDSSGKTALHIAIELHLTLEALNYLSKQGAYGGSGAQSVSAAELVPAIIDHCISSYERRPSDGEHLSIGQTFSHYINRISRKETILFDDLRAWSPSEHRQKRKPKDKETTQTAAQAPRHGHDISAAIKKAKDLYCDIKDVRDQLNILKSVAQYQQIVQRGLASKEVDESRFSSTYVVKDLRELDSISERIQLAINTTLSLQQSKVANRQATEATRQGKTVMTCTFATILFLPLSFLSSLFALDVASFQEAPAWAFYIIFLVSIGISTILGLGVFYLDSVKRAKENILRVARDACEDAFKPTLDSPIVSDGIIDDKKGEGKCSTRLKTEGQERGIMSRFRGCKWRTKVDDVEKY